MLDFLFTPVFAEEASAATAATGGLQSFLPMILIFGIFYFLMIRPQAKKAKDEQAMISTLGKGEEIFTKSGLFGTIRGMTDKVITLEIAEGTKIKILRSQIGGKASTIFEKKTEEKK
ncbi:preprotein translocase subunit YajC [Halobacteriovorax marinus]|uniref:Sec translocon accessory complex subunit YajC n=1 Tax=Halobacteriovorax marinus TaxID=97084 RepID=A0A1Y5F960_9BACT|nr:preprotein translocase subunit YajC [Halobacteriovorax marinus]